MTNDQWITLFAIVLAGVVGPLVLQFFKRRLVNGNSWEERRFANSMRDQIKGLETDRDTWRERYMDQTARLAKRGYGPVTRPLDDKDDDVESLREQLDKCRQERMVFIAILSRNGIDISKEMKVLREAALGAGQTDETNINITAGGDLNIGEFVGKDKTTTTKTGSQA